MRTPKTLAAAVAALLAMGACAPAAQQPDGPSAAPTSTVRVTNNNWADMNVFVVRNGMRVRLGTVTSLNTTTFRVPSAATRGVTQVRIVADPIGSSRGYVSEVLQLYPGQQVAMTVQNAIQMSSVAVWDRRR